jgi:hypothetical protein
MRSLFTIAIGIGRIAPVDKPVSPLGTSEDQRMTCYSPRDTVVRTTTDLFLLWQGLMGDGGFSRRSVWLLLLDEKGRPEPTIVPIDDVPSVPDRRSVNGLATLVSGLIAEGIAASIALLVSRPGHRDMTEDDRRWARALAPISGWPVHLATTDHVQVFAPDDLVAA